MYDQIPPRSEMMMCQIRKSSAEVASSNHIDADSGARSLIQIKR